MLALVIFGQLGAYFSTSAKIKEVKIRGYVTAMTSPNAFEIEDYKIKRDAAVWVAMDGPVGAVAAPEELKVGALVEVRGDFNDETGELTASKVKIVARKLSSFDSAAILETRPTDLQQIDGKWSGTILAEGRKIHVEPTTALSFKLNRTETKEAEKAAKTKPNAPANAGRAPNVDPDESDLPAAEQAEGATPLTSLADLGAGVYLTYHGTEQSDGSVLASQIVFVKNEKEKGEARLWKTLASKQKPAKPEPGAPGVIWFGPLRFKVLDSPEVQAYVARVGQSLVPAYQKNLPDGDPNKLDFRFTVIKRKEFNALASPDGQVILHDEVLQVLENEAQLAAVLAHAIAHATQEHAFRQREYNRTRHVVLRTSMFLYDLVGLNMSDLMEFSFVMQNGYGRRLENQAERLGLQYMIASGYDPREARRVWQLIDQKYGEDDGHLYWAGHDNNLERRSFQTLLIQNYAGFDFASMKRNEPEFKQMAVLAREAAAKKKR
jgi:hypothetical protein